MKSLPSALVVDTSILISALLGRSGPLFLIGRHASLLTTDRALVEAERRVALGLRRPDLLIELSVLSRQFEIAPLEGLAASLDEAETTLRDAIPSRNGSVTDTHLLALAWKTDADIWSHDRDFAGTGVASWSTLNLLRALALVQP